jgi:hypothetical protein
MSTKIGTASNYLDLLDQLDDFLTATGHAWGKNYSGVGTGDLVSYIGTASSVAETFTITATNATTFTVVGSTTGALANATVGTPYTSAVIGFTINAGGTAFQSGDVFVINTSPKWTRLRAAGCADQTKRTSDMTDIESAFDDNQGTIAFRDATSGFIDFEMHRASEVREFLLQIHDTTATRTPRDFQLQYRDNLVDPWTTAQSWSSVTWANTYQAQVFTLTTPPGAHKYWRFNVSAINGATVQFRIAKLQLREKPGDFYGLEERAEFVWRAPGLDGTKNIHTGLITYGSANADAWSLGFNGFRVFDNTRGTFGQPNQSDGKYLSLVNSPIGYWFVANGQRVMIVTKAAAIYQTAYIGFGFPYEPPSIHTFPMLVGASTNSRTLRYNSTSNDFRHPADPGRFCLTAFYPDAQWREHVNRSGAISSSTPDGGFDNQVPGTVWPTSRSFENLQMDFVRDNIDGSRPLMPLVLWHQSGPEHLWGEFDGYFWATGFGTVPEAIIRESGFDHLAVSNIFRTGLNHFAAVRLD